MRFSTLSFIAGATLGILAGAYVAVSLAERYYIQGSSHSFVWIDRLTGQVKWCDASECSPITQKD